MTKNTTSDYTDSLIILNTVIIVIMSVIDRTCKTVALTHVRISTFSFLVLSSFIGNEFLATFHILWFKEYRYNCQSFCFSFILHKGPKWKCDLIKMVNASDWFHMLVCVKTMKEESMNEWLYKHFHLWLLCMLHDTRLISYVVSLLKHTTSEHSIYKSCR